MLMERSRMRSIRCWRTFGGRFSHSAILGISRSGTSVAKDHSAQFISQALGFLRICRAAELFGQLKKILLFAFFGLDAVLDELYEHSVGTDFARPGHGANFGCDRCRKTDALAYCLVCGAHGTSMHQNGVWLQAVTSLSRISLMRIEGGLG